MCHTVYITTRFIYCIAAVWVLYLKYFILRICKIPCVFLKLKKQIVAKCEQDIPENLQFYFKSNTV
jgi:hypothetical protein